MNREPTPREVLREFLGQVRLCDLGFFYANVDTVLREELGDKYTERLVEKAIALVRKILEDLNNKTED